MPIEEIDANGDVVASEFTLDVINVPDNTAQGLVIKDSTPNTYLTFVTTNGSEQITLGQKLVAGSVSIEGSNFSITGGSATGLTALQLTTGATNGYVATSDASGNISWQAVGTGTTGWTDDGVIVRLNTATDDVAIGSSSLSGTEKLRVTSGAVLFDGTTGATPVSGAGTRLMWIPAKFSFRAGTVSSTQWDAASIGDYSVAIGRDVTASAANSSAFGYKAIASLQGQSAIANGAFAADGDAQVSVFVMRIITTDATETELTLDGAVAGAGNRITLADNTTYLCKFSIVARRTETASEQAGYELNAVVNRNTGAASTSILGIRAKTTWAETTAAWDAEVTADTTNGSVKVTVTGESSKTIRWVCRAEVTKVSS